MAPYPETATHWLAGRSQFNLYRVLLCVSSGHVSVGAINERVRHVGFQHAENGPLDHVVSVALSPNSPKSHSALAMLVSGQHCRHPADKSTHALGGKASL